FCFFFCFPFSFSGSLIVDTAKNLSVLQISICRQREKARRRFKVVFLTAARGKKSTTPLLQPSPSPPPPSSATFPHKENFRITALTYRYFPRPTIFRFRWHFGDHKHAHTDDSAREQKEVD